MIPLTRDISSSSEGPSTPPPPNSHFSLCSSQSNLQDKSQFLDLITKFTLYITKLWGLVTFWQKLHNVASDIYSFPILQFSWCWQILRMTSSGFNWRTCFMRSTVVLQTRFLRSRRQDNHFVRHHENTPRGNQNQNCIKSKTSFAEYPLIKNIMLSSTQTLRLPSR